MATIRQIINLRPQRKIEGRVPRSIKLDKLNEGDSFLVEIVFDKKNGVVKKYMFSPQDLSGRKNITYRVSGEEVFWLSKLQPKEVLYDLYEDAPVLEYHEPEPAEMPKKPREKRVLVFGQDEKLVSVWLSLEIVSRYMNILPEVIDRICKFKRQSQETKLFFRYYRNHFRLDIDQLFNLTVSQYDQMCKRKPKKTE